MEYAVFLLIVLLIVAIVVLRRGRSEDTTPTIPPSRYNDRGFDHNRIHRNGTKYDDCGFDYDGYNAKGYNAHGYTAKGRNEKGQYNRLYDTTSGPEEGFLSPTDHPVGISTHANERIMERLGIYDQQKLRETAKNAYKHGKSKRQIKKTSAYLVEELEKKHEGRIVLIYHNYIYIFAQDNSLVTVYKNDRIPL